MSPESIAVLSVALSALVSTVAMAYVLVRSRRDTERLFLLMKSKSASEFGLASAMQRTKTPEIRPSFGVEGNGDERQPTIEELRGAPTTSAEFNQPS